VEILYEGFKDWKSITNFERSVLVVMVFMVFLKWLFYYAVVYYLLKLNKLIEIHDLNSFPWLW
jgi:hypothetical protein